MASRNVPSMKALVRNRGGVAIAMVDAPAAAGWRQ
jgi:hypothetical protein